MKETVLNTQNLLALATELQAIAQTGLAYCKNPYDRERYEQLMELSAKVFSGNEKEACDFKVKFLAEIGYASPKLDVRAIVRKENKLLLVQEIQDGKWALPGGWADVNLSPSECVVKEVREETGLNCQVIKLLALWDTAKHDHPPHWPYTYKCIFHCEVQDAELVSGYDIMDVNFFPINNLPPLSVNRITLNQINTLIGLLDAGISYTIFD